MEGPKGTKRNQWREVDFPVGIDLMVNGHCERLTPISVVTDEDGDEIAAIAIHHIPIGDDGNGVTSAKVICPGLCGHYGCGGVLTVSMN